MSREKIEAYEIPITRHIDRAERVLCCTHERCPYRELDGIQNYLADFDEPLKKAQKRILRLMFSYE